MYKLLLLFPLFLFVSCQDTSQPEAIEAVKDYVTFSGKITNNTVDSVRIMSRDFSKTILVDEEGNFKDTFNLKSGSYYFATQQKGIVVFLKNAYNLSLDIDMEAFQTSAKFTGEGAKENNFLVKKASFEEELFFQDLSHLVEADLDSAIEVLIDQAADYVHAQEGIDSLLIHESLTDLGSMSKSLKEYYAAALQLLKEMPKGSASPVFADYENYDGTKTSLADFNGKNVYIDIWATWCGPCKAEIPALKTLEQDYEGKNIAFVSLSVDDAQAHQGSWEVANEKWRAMVKDKELSGVQLLAPKGWESAFIRDFRVNSIPRFILLDTEGNIISPDAPRPSDQKLRTLLEEIL